jgi:hypothetical protein
MRTPSRAASIPVAMALAALLAGPGAGAAGAETCNGFVSGERDFDTLVVPDDARCTISPGASVTVGGKVDVGRNAVLGMTLSRTPRSTLRAGGGMSLDDGSSFLNYTGRLILRGNMIGKPEKVLLGDDSYIGGRVTVAAITRSLEFEDVSIDGDLEIGYGRGGETSLNRVHVGGDVSVRDKTGINTITVTDSTMDRLAVLDNISRSIRIVDNIIRKDFWCLRNRVGEAQVFRNLVAGESRTQNCRSEG